MSTQAVLVRKAEGRKSRDALLAAGFLALLGLEVAGATQVGRVVKKPVKFVLKRSRAAEAHLIDLESLKERAGQALEGLLREEDGSGFCEYMDPIIFDLAEFLEDLGHVLEWSAVGRFIREPDLEKIVQRAKGTMSNLERRYDVAEGRMKRNLLRRLEAGQDRLMLDLQCLD